MKKMRAAVAEIAKQPLKIEEVTLDDPKENEVLVKVVATGICHTDTIGINGDAGPLPAVLGHEGAGIVEKVGSAVKNIAVGDHVVLSFSYCGHCDACLSGHPGMCEHFNELNFGGTNFDRTHRLHTTDGQPISTFFGQSSFAEYVVVNEHNVVKVDPSVDLQVLGPLGCGIQTGAGTVLKYLQPTAKDSIAIFGTGSVGLSAIMAAKIAGTKHIIAIDRNDKQLAFAKELGATEIINNTNVDTVEAIKQIVPSGVNYAVDTTGVSVVVLSAIHSLAPAGECVEVGVGGDITINLGNDLLTGSRKLSGLVEGGTNPKEFIPELVQYYKNNEFPFDKLITFYDFTDINQAFDDMKNGQVVKPVVKIGDAE